MWLQCRWQPELLPGLRHHLQEFESTCAGEASPFWAELNQLAERERVSALLYDVDRGWNLCPSVVERKLHDFAAYTSVQNRIYLDALAEILETLAAADIPAIVLKGAALAEMIYGNIGLRPMVDLDLLVRKMDARRALSILQADGYAAHDRGTRDGSTLEFENEIMLVMAEPTPIQTELHWSLFDSPHHQAVLDEDWLWLTAQPAEIAGCSTLILGPEAQILHLSGHVALHHVEHAHLLWLHDLAEIITQAEIDWDSVLQHAVQYDLVLSLQFALNRVAAYWQTPIPASVLAELNGLQVSSAESRILISRMDGPRPVLQRFWLDLTGIPDWPARLRYAWQNLFPNPIYMHQRYQIRLPLMLPILYPYRWVLGLTELLKRPRL
ncbi:MAG: nucleotidyltransferase family protein [Caldilineales bacterium]|nr:nucleotidyltransferase family protein [Caldilineales bacterium]